MNAVWSYDFVYDACANGHQLKCLTVVDEFTRECLAIDVAGSIRAKRLIEVLNRLISVRGAPRYLRSDNEPEFASSALLKWTLDETIETALIDPGKPWQNGTNESFNGKFRDECLAMEWFRNRTEARIVIEDWRRHYNEARPHSSLQYQTPTAFRRAIENHSTTGDRPCGRRCREREGDHVCPGRAYREPTHACRNLWEVDHAREGGRASPVKERALSSRTRAAQTPVGMGWRSAGRARSGTEGDDEEETTLHWDRRTPIRKRNDPFHAPITWRRCGAGRYPFAA